MLSFNLSPIFKARGIEKPYSFLVKSGLAPHSANVLLSSQTRSFRLDHVELLCKILICEPNDILVYREDASHKIAEDHPLNNLKQSEANKSLKETITTIPYKQLKELTNQINQMEAEKK